MPDHVGSEQRVIGRGHQERQCIRQGFERAQNARRRRVGSRNDGELSLTQQEGELRLPLRQRQILQAKDDAPNLRALPQGVDDPQQHRAARDRHQRLVRQAGRRRDRIGRAPAAGQHERGEKPPRLSAVTAQGHAKTFS
jgi:hypothetical protein